jgi:hypothetical protein
LIFIGFYFHLSVAMEKPASLDTLFEINGLLGMTPDNPSNVINLIRDQNPNTFKEKLTQIFVSLSSAEAKQIYKLFELLPEVKEAWLKALEIKVEKLESEVKQAEHNKEIVVSLDLELSESIRKHTECDEDNQDLVEILQLILKKEIESEAMSAEPSELEIELITNNQDIMFLIKAYFKNKKKIGQQL